MDDAAEEECSAERNIKDEGLEFAEECGEGCAAKKVGMPFWKP